MRENWKTGYSVTIQDIDLALGTHRGGAGQQALVKAYRGRTNGN